MERVARRAFERAGFRLSDDQIAAFVVYGELLQRWNRRMNLTRITEPSAVATAHFVDSVLVLDHVRPKLGADVVDVGSGAGFPGLPVAIARPDLRVTLVEAVGKKTAFLHAAVATMELSNAGVVEAKLAPDATPDALRGAFDGVLSRYAGSVEWLVERSLPMLKPRGWLAAHKYDDADERRALARSPVEFGAKRVQWSADARGDARRRFACAWF